MPQMNYVSADVASLAKWVGDSDFPYKVKSMTFKPIDSVQLIHRTQRLVPDISLAPSPSLMFAETHTPSPRWKYRMTSRGELQSWCS